MEQPLVEQVRSFNRTMTERVGALHDHFLGRAHPLGEARLLWEIGAEALPSENYGGGWGLIQDTPAACCVRWRGKACWSWSRAKTMAGCARSGSRGRVSASEPNWTSAPMPLRIRCWSL